MAWPPENLLVNTEEIINECELMELLPQRAQDKAFVPVVELAALLVQGEYVHARHTWRRWKDQNPPILLAEWWKVGAAMLEGTDPTIIWQSLAHIQANHPAPLNAYATQVGTAYRKRILLSHPPTKPYTELLQFESPAALEAFCHEHKVGPNYTSYTTTASTSTTSSKAKASLTQIVSFLDSKSDGISAK